MTRIADEASGRSSESSGRETEDTRQGEHRRDELHQTCNARTIWRSKSDDRTRKRRFRRDHTRAECAAESEAFGGKVAKQRRSRPQGPAINISRAVAWTRKSPTSEREYMRRRKRSFRREDSPQANPKGAPASALPRNRSSHLISTNHGKGAIKTPDGGYYDTRWGLL